MMNGVTIRATDSIGGAVLYIEYVENGHRKELQRLSIPDDDLADITRVLLIRAYQQNHTNTDLHESVTEAAQYG